MKWLSDSIFFRCLGLISVLTVAGITVASCNSPSSLSNEEALSLHSDNKAHNSRNDRLRIVAFGDSLTAGLGVSPNESYPARLPRMQEWLERLQQVVCEEWIGFLMETQK